MDIIELEEHMLVQDGQTLLKISTLYDDHVTAQVLYENDAVPERTKVRTYFAPRMAKWKPASTQLVNKSDDAWGFNDPSR